MGKGPLFLNTPIASSVHDVVGVEMYAEKLDMAIDAGAQMIALASPFGAGKSSVIELLQKKRKDLDRTDASEGILQFLKELRKYYVPERTVVSYLNRVTFLVNIKPEAELAGSEAESLYAKMFDYILPLRTINIDNYDAVLNGLLAEHSEELMRENKDFLCRIMETGEYKRFDNESRMELAAVLQDAASISEAFERGTRFALDYCLKIRGFRDLEAADTFVELVSRHPDLLASEELYEYTHGRLVNGTLKKKYTNRRKGVVS